MGCCGFLICTGMLSLALLGRESLQEAQDFTVTLTRSTLSPGQSGGVAVTHGAVYYTPFTVTADNDVLTVKNGVYTAVKPGTCQLTVTFGQEIQTVTVTVTHSPGTDSIVYASPTGERYHKTRSHAGSNAVSMTEEEALQSGKTPCKTCFKEQS